MTSITSSSSWVVLKAALKRLKWLSILYGVTLVLEAPLLLWMELAKQKAIQGPLWAEVANKTNLSPILFNPILHFTNIVVPIVFGLILFYYLQKDRASTFFHSLPIKREFLYFQNLLAGLVLIWLPILINGLLAYGVFGIFGVTEGQWNNGYNYSMPIDSVYNGPSIVSVGQVMVYWLFLNLLMTGLFYTFTVFVGMFTGNFLLQGALTFIGLFLPLGLYLLVKFNLSKLLYGIPGDSFDQNIEWLSPIVSYLNAQNYRSMFKVATWYEWYIAAAVLAGVISILLYKKRDVEAAGETLAAEWIRWVFKYGVATCAALTGGAYFSSVNDNSIWALYLGHFIGGVLGYVVADMIAYKSFQFYKRWKGMVIFGAVFIMLVLSVKLDFLGYENFVPEQNEVTAVILNNFSSEGGIPLIEGLKGKDNIQKVRELHRQIIKFREENQAHADTLKLAARSPGGYQSSVGTLMTVNITYVLESGKKINRSYSIDPSRYREFLYPIFNSPETKQNLYSRLLKTDGSKIDQLNLTNHRFGKNVRIYKPAEIEEALAALKEDVMNVTYEAAVEGKKPLLASVEFVSKSMDDLYYSPYNINYHEEFKNFSAFLVKHGYMEELFINPKEISSILIKKANSEESWEIKDQQQIKTLLDWSSIDDPKFFIMRKQKEMNDFVVYYGQINVNNNGPVYIRIENSPSTLAIIDQILKKH